MGYVRHTMENINYEQLYFKLKEVENRLADEARKRRPGDLDGVFPLIGIIIAGVIIWANIQSIYDWIKQK